MKLSIDYGVDMINDIYALQKTGTIEIISNSNVLVCLMHMQNSPKNMQNSPQYKNIILEVESFFKARTADLNKAGIKNERIMLDPGFGFGKTFEHNIDLFKKNPHISNVILDKRLSRLNLIYLYSLMKNIKKYKFSKVYDLQNSSRTAFYKNILFPKATKEKWSSTETTLPEGTTKEDFDKDSVLSRFDHQLKSSGINTNHTFSPDFSWSPTDITQIKNYHQLNKYIILFLKFVF